MDKESGLIADGYWKFYYPLLAAQNHGLLSLDRVASKQILTMQG
ncbi:hypothetical protein [Microcystis aeruginosa]|nr:hypothetical protein [Microcystis aeruginosa]MDB9413220.1 hypothetical protein [Microcystis aeruginosa CS-567/02]MDB9433834.1 hypothetical protein [Microcystis aeruginosa CS-552/01]